MSEMNVRRTAEHIRSTMTHALTAFENFPEDRRLQVSYEDLLRDPIRQLQLCGSLVLTEVSAEDAKKTVEKHDFSNHKDTGELKFRRKGKTGVWKESPNFTPEVRQISENILGQLRARLGYRDEAMVD